MMRTSLFALVLLGSACSAKASAPASTAPDHAVAAAPAEPAALQQSHFARTPQGTISEAELQKILESPLELDLPSRVGVLPIVEAEDWRGPGPSYERVSPGLSAFAEQLPADDSFTQVTQMMPIPSGALGMEALRELAARYKLRYLLLYRENVERDRHGNGWAAGYITGVGALFLPGSTLRVDGYAEATLFDVKTGILLFTVRHRMQADKRSTVWQRNRKLTELQRKLALQAADGLAKDARTALARLQEGAGGQDIVNGPANDGLAQQPPAPRAELPIAADG